MDGYSIDGKNAMLNHLGTQITHVAALNASGVESSSARVAITFSPASNGSISASNQPVLTMPSGAVASSIGFYTALTGGTLMAKDELETPETFANDGTLTLTSITLDLNAV